MAEIGIRALKQNASAVVAAAAGGQRLTVTDRGRPVAQIGPLPQRRLDALIAAGLARPARRPIAELPPPARRRARQPALSDVLASQRAAER